MPLPNNALRAAASKWLEEGLRLSVNPQGERWKLEPLAEAAGVARATIWRIQHRRTDPMPGTILALSTALQVPLPALYASLVPPSEHGAQEGAQGHIRPAANDARLTRRPHIAGRVTDDLDSRSSADLRWLMRAALEVPADQARLQEVFAAMERALDREKASKGKEGGGR